jgi:hypothetical protein
MLCKRCAPNDRRTGGHVAGRSKREMNLRSTETLRHPKIPVSPQTCYAVGCVLMPLRG